MTAELKPCPFCGGEASEVEDQGHSTAYNVGCFNGDCTIEPNTWADTKAEAIAAWNTRADLSRDLEQARQDIADLRQAVRYANDHADQAKSERDAAIARAEKAEADRDEWRKTANTKIEMADSTALRYKDAIIATLQARDEVLRSAAIAAGNAIVAIAADADPDISPLRKQMLRVKMEKAVKAAFTRDA